MNIYNDYCQIKLPGLNREACSNSFGQEPGEGDRNVLTNFRVTSPLLHMGYIFVAFSRTWEQRMVVKKPI